MRLLLMTALIMLASPALAKDITITLNDQDQQNLLSLMDAGVKQLGMRGVSAAATILDKMKAAEGPPPAVPAPASEPEKK